MDVEPSVAAEKAQVPQEEGKNDGEATFFQGKGDVKIFTRRWIPGSTVRAVVLLVHGLAEHCGRHEEAAVYLRDRGFAVYALDHRGHGQSEGQRVFVETFEDYIHDMKVYWDSLVEKDPSFAKDAPRFIFGHSMGGGLALAFGIKYPHYFHGAIYSAPAIIKGTDITAMQIYAVRAINWIAPSLGVVALKNDGISSIPEEVKAYQDDKLNYMGKVTARLGVELLALLAYIGDNLDKIDWPFLVIQGKDDPLTHPDGSALLEKKAPSKDKTIKYYNTRHEILHDVAKDEALKDIADWLEAHLQQSKL